MRSAIAVSLLAGCHPQVIDLLPSLDGRTPATVALLRSSSAQEPSGTSGDVVDATIATLLEDDGRARPTLALMYEAPISELDWRAGPIAHDEGGRSRLRRPARISGRSSEDAPWMDVTAEAMERPALLGFRDAWAADRCDCFDEAGWCTPRCAVDAPNPPAPPLPWPELECPPELTSITTTVTGDRVTTCRGSPRAPSCAEWERATPLGACVRLGRSCAAVDAEGWPDPLPRGDVRYVAPGHARGDGTRQMPWSLEVALRSARDGDTLLLAAGEHVADGFGPNDLTLLGVCAERTIVRSRALTTITASVSISDLRLFNSAELRVDGALTTSGVAISGAVAIVAAGGSWSASDGRVTSHIYVEGTHRATDVELGREGAHALRGSITIERASIPGRVTATAGGTARIADSTLLPPELEAAVLVNGATVELDRVAVYGGDRGVSVEEGGSAMIERSYFDAQAHAGIDAEGPAARLTVRDTLLRRGETGVDVRGDTRARLFGVAVTESRHTALFVRTAADPGAPDLHVTDLRAETGIYLQAGEFKLERARLTDAERVPFRVYVSDLSASLNIDASDLEIVGGLGAGIDLSGSIAHPINAELTRVALRGPRGTGISVDAASATVRFLDLAISDVRASVSNDVCATGTVDFCQGTAILCNVQTARFSFDLERFLIEGASGGIAFGHEVDMRATNGAVRDASRAVIYDPRSGDWRERLPRVRLAGDAIESAAQF